MTHATLPSGARQVRVLRQQFAQAPALPFADLPPTPLLPSVRSQRAKGEAGLAD